MSEPENPGPGKTRVNGEVYEYPYRVEDFHGEVIADELDTVPPFLNQEEIDVLASDLEERLDTDDISGYRPQVLASVLAKLPDSEHGRGGTPDWIREVGSGD